MVGLKDSEGLQNVSCQRLLGLQHAKQFGVVQLIQDGNDLLGQDRVHALDQRKQALDQRLRKRTSGFHIKHFQAKC